MRAISMTVATPDALSSAPGPPASESPCAQTRKYLSGSRPASVAITVFGRPSRIVEVRLTRTRRPARAAASSVRPSTYDTAKTGTGLSVRAGSDPSRDQSTYRLGSLGALVRIAAGSAAALASVAYAV